jgi:signal transduction histidine kinase
LENGNPTDIILLIAAGCMGMLILVVSIILFVVYYQKKVLAQKNNFQRQLLSATVDVQEKERERIAKNVHDDLGMKLSVIRQGFQKIMRNTESKELITRVAGENIRVIDDSIEIVRNVAKELFPPGLVKLGFTKSLAELCKQITNAGQLTVSFMQGNSEIKLPEKTGLQLYRVTQELLNNIIKHSAATEVRVDLQRNETHTSLTITHNGKGISSVEINKLMNEEKGTGLKSLQSRAQLINAAINYETGNSEQKPFIEVHIGHEEKNH